MDQDENQIAILSPPRRTLEEMLGLARAADDGILDYELDLEKLGEDIKNKVDDITELLDYCAARGAVIGKRAAELSAKASAFANRAARLEARVTEHMEADRKARAIPDTERYELPGKFHKFALFHSERATVIAKDPDPAAYLKFGAGLVKRSYSWKLADLKKALVAGNAAVKDLVKIEKHPYIKISAKA